MDLEIQVPKMKAKTDVTVTDRQGLERLIFAGQTVPVELEEFVKEASGDDEPKAKMETKPEVNKMETGPEISKAKTSSRRAK